MTPNDTIAAQVRSLAAKASKPGTVEISTSVIIDGVAYEVTLRDKRNVWSKDREV